ncbi:MAG: tRNA 2-thiouridine(34) synthase MnmA [bacterium]|nr:tRNA 2-thiouridine(34) synthase MnmA [bacterium]
MARVVLAMSGGVDSSVAAHLLKEAGHDVVGVFMRHGEPEPVCAVDSAAPTPLAPLLPIVDARADHKQGCCSASDAEDARRVADEFDIPFYALDLSRDFDRIMDYFVDEYTQGRTPNPCVACNNWLKFGRLFDYADGIGADFVATGHYARLTKEPGETVPALRRGVDDRKDQAYVLFGVKRELLNRMLLPVGDMRKDEIRDLAAKLNLRVADKRDSQEICFVTSGKHAEFVRDRAGGDRSGEIVDTTGKTLGRHEGIERFTIGQRKGIGIAVGEPIFVVKIEAAENRVIVGPREALGRDTLTANRCNWLRDVPDDEFRCEAKIRYNSPASPARARRLADGRMTVTFDDPQMGVAPGQAAVLFADDRVIGGGWIE